MAAHMNTNYSSEDELLEAGVYTDGYDAAAPRRRLGYYFLAAAGFVACGVGAAVHMGRPARSGATNARMLFESPIVHEVATRNIMNVADHMMGENKIGDESRVRSQVEKHFKQMVENLEATSPQTVRPLEDVKITPEHEKQVAHILSYLSDPRAQKIGVKIAHAVRDAGSDDPEVLKEHVSKKMKPYLAEFAQLHREMYPEGSPLRMLGESGDGFADLFTEKRLRVMKSSSDSWDMHFEGVKPRQLQYAAVGQAKAAPAGGFGSGAADGDSALGMAEEVTGITAALVEEGSTVLKMARTLSKMTGHDLNVDPRITTGLGAPAYVLEGITCELDAIADDVNPVEVMGCPFEYGSEAFDASRDFLTMAGILGDNNPANGEQGNHAGEKVRLGLLNDGKNPIATKQDVDDFDIFN